MHRCKICSFFFFFSFLCMTAVRVECEGGAAAWFAGTLAVQSVHGHRLPPTRSYGPFRVFFQASCSWQSEGLFGQLFSVALPVQALRGPPCLVFFCCSECQAHRGAPWLGSYSVVQCVRRLMGQPLYCSAADAGVWGERCGDGSTPYT